jgi:MFS family permease
MPLREQLRALPRAAYILFAGTFINRFGSFVVPMLAIYLTRHGYSASKSGLAIGAYGAGLLVASAAGGHFADRFGRRNTIALSMFSSAAAMLALSQAKSFAAIVVLTAIAGATTELYRPASHALIGDLVPPEHRLIAFSMYRLAINLGFAAGPTVAGLLANRSFLIVFVSDAATSVLYGTIALVALPHGLLSNFKLERTGEALRTALRDRRVVTFVIAAMFAAMVDFQMGSTFALHVLKEGFSAAAYGALISINGVLIVVFELFITTRVQRLQARPVIAIGYLLNGVGFALTGIAHTFPALAATVVIWTFAEMLYSPMSGTYITQIAPEQYRGRYAGLFVTMWSAGMLFGPTLGTLVFDHNEAILWWSCAVLGVLSAALVMPKRRTAAQRVAPM